MSNIEYWILETICFQGIPAIDFHVEIPTVRNYIWQFKIAPLSDKYSYGVTV